MREHRVLVCGGRDYASIRYAFTCLDGVVPRPTLIIQGGNPGSRPGGIYRPGADRIAKAWAMLRDVPCDEYAVDHALDGPWPGAGPKRNGRMLAASKPHLVMALPGGRGTADMVRRAKAVGVPVIEVMKQ